MGMEFKFEIGDLTTRVASKVLVVAGSHFMNSFQIYEIRERIYQECYNATQIYYQVRAMDRNGSVHTKLFSMSEDELVAYDESNFQKWLSGAIDRELEQKRKDKGEG